MGATLPSDRDLVDLLRLDHLPDVSLQQIVGHPEPVARIQHLLRQEEAVLAVQVADRPGRLGHHVEVIRGLLRASFWHGQWFSDCHQ